MFSALSQFIFGGYRSSSSSKHEKHKRIGFDLRQSELQLGLGEVLLASFFPIEDIKGNSDEMGLLRITNQRIIWICVDKKGVNLSIGWDSVSIVFEQNCRDALGSNLGAINIMTSYDNCSYEFVFTKMGTIGQNSSDWISSTYWIAATRLHSDDRKLLFNELTPSDLIDCFDVIRTIHKCYKRSSSYRCCVANSFESKKSRNFNAISKNQFSRLYDELSGEKKLFAYKRITYVGDRTVQQPGIMLLTNIRLIWCDDEFAFRNLSMPYSRISNISSSIKNNKQLNKLMVYTLDEMKKTNSFEFTWKRSSSSSTSSSLATNSINSNGNSNSMTTISSSNQDDNYTNFKLNFDDPDLLSTQAQKLFSLYRSRPRFGPESSEDCIRIASLLRPIDELVQSDSFFASKKQQSIKVNQESLIADNKLNRDVNLDKTTIDTKSATMITSLKNSNNDTNWTKDASKFDESERQLNKLSQNLQTNSHPSKLVSYATQTKSIGFDKPIVYCHQLGLSIEKPPDGTSIAQIWQIEL